MKKWLLAGMVLVPLGAAAQTATVVGKTGQAPGVVTPRGTPIITENDLAQGFAGKVDLANALPPVANLAALKNLQPGSFSTVYRTGFLTAGDGGAISYSYSSVACSLNTGAGDNGLQVQPAMGGGCWLANAPAGGVDIRVWGVQTGSSSDQTALIQGALNDAAALLTPAVVHIPAIGAVVSSANLAIPPGVQVQCDVVRPGYVPGENYTAYANLIVNASYTITGPTTFGGASAIRGCLIARQGMSAPTNLRQGIQQRAAFAGTAISCSGGTDFAVVNNLIVGFNQAIATTCDRSVVTGDRIDANNGILITSCGDTCEVHDDETWPFVTPVYVLGANTQDSAVASVANNGSGLCRVSLSATPGTPLVTGDTVAVKAPGTTGCSGRFSVTSISTTVLDLAGSTYGGAYTGGGAVYLNGNIRFGTAFEIDNPGGLPHMERMVDYGHDISLHFGGGSSTVTGADDVRCHDCWLDGDQSADDYDPVPTGLLVDGGAGHVSFSGYDSRSGRSIALNSPKATLTIDNGSHIGLLGANNGTSGIALYQGDIQLSNGNADGSGAAGTVYFGPAFLLPYRASFSNFPYSGTPTLSVPGQCGLLSRDGIVGPCAWTPALVGATLGGGAIGTYSVSTYGSIHLDLYWAGGVASTSSVPLQITGLPASAGVAGGNCSVSIPAYLTLTSSNFTQVTAGIAPNTAAIDFYEIGTNIQPSQVVGTQLPGYGTSVAFQLSCDYQAHS